MNKNPVLLMVLGFIGFVLISGFIWMSVHTGHTPQQSQAQDTHDPFDVASGDTNNEVLRSIVARQKTLEKENNDLLARNKQLQSENQAKTQQNIQAVEQSFKEEIAHAKSSLEMQFKQKLEQVKQHDSTASDSRLEYPVNDLENDNHQSPHVITTVPDLTTQAMIDDESHIRPKAVTQKESPQLPSNSDTSDDDKETIPYYTIPDGATIANTALLSPLVGEVPVNGQLQEPAFPFKAVLSYKDTESMFTANGIPLPDGIAGTVLQGYSVGNMSLGCARAYVMKILFVFNDGHYAVFPDAKSDAGDSATQVYPKNAIGYLSDPYNNACISGRYLTDAPKVITSLAAFGAGAGVGGAIAQAQTQTLTNVTQGTSATIFNGNLGKYAAGVAIGDGAKAALEWYKARVNNIFDAVFVPSTLNGQPRKLILNVTRTIPIDLNQQGRTLSYDTDQDMSATDSSFE